MNYLIRILIPVVLIVTSVYASTKNDSLVLKNGNVMNGEIKSMERDVVVIETDYSDADFRIKWNKVQEIYSQTEFMVSLSNGKKHYGRLNTSSDLKINIIKADNEVIECELNDIVSLIPVEKSFLDRVNASIDIGINLAKAHDLRQLTTRITIGYITRKWSTDVSFNTLRSTQEIVDPTERTEGALNYRYVLRRRWYSVATVSLLSNTEQKLDLRMNAQIGLGKFFIRTNAIYWGGKIGLNRNVEKYSNETPDRYTWEGYVGTELNLYNIGDLSLLTIVMVYPSFTEKGRWRADFNLDLNYDLPLDFYIKVGGSLNYDNRPAEGGSETDYVFQSGIGWKW